MRRTERAILARPGDRRRIRGCSVCRLGLVDGDRPYVVPMSFGYDGRCIYLHCAHEGRKIDILRRNGRVCVEFDAMDGLVDGGAQGCKWSMRYRSAIAEGVARFVEDPQAKREALAAILAQYAPGTFDFPEAMVARTCVVAVDIETLCGKHSP